MIGQAPPRELVFLDLETSTLKPESGGEILDFAALRISSDLQVVHGKVDRKCVMQWPERAEAKALEVNRYDAREWAQSAFPIRLALVDFTALVAGVERWAFVGHNPVFDIGHLRAAFVREGLAMPDWKYTLDTASMAWPLYVKGMVDAISLKELSTRYGLSNVGAHRAMADVVRTVRLFAKLLGLPPPVGGTL